MGLIRRMIRLVPTVAAFAIGYYVGTIDSGAYECVFDAPVHEDRIEHASPLESMLAEATVPDAIITYPDARAPIAPVIGTDHGASGGERYD